MMSGRTFFRTLRRGIWTLLLIGSTGCGTQTEYVRSDSKPYKNEAGDVCLSPAAFADLLTAK